MIEDPRHLVPKPGQVSRLTKLAVMQLVLGPLGAGMMVFDMLFVHMTPRLPVLVVVRMIVQVGIQFRTRQGLRWMLEQCQLPRSWGHMGLAHMAGSMMPVE